MPLRATADSILVNWFSIEIRNAAGKRAYYISFVTDLPVPGDIVAEQAACLLQKAIVTSFFRPALGWRIAG